MTIYSRYNPPIGFYVYGYLREDGTYYYIGKGKNGRAWYRFKHETHTNMPVDHSRITIFESGLLEHEAFTLEIKLIEQYGRKDIGTGILRNRTPGGEGNSGARGPMTAEHREKLSIIKTGKKQPNISKALIGKSQTPESNLKRSEALSGTKHDWVTTALKGKSQTILECPHCKRTGGTAMKRWHFDNCKMLG